ncbi:MAG: hypothetical protein ACR2QU_03855, partial [Gammaproteobacteria bacterium]
MTVLIATSVVRGSRQGESHGGVFLVDLDERRVAQTIDWNTTGIDWQGRGWDRGMRGIAFDEEKVFIAASDELFVYSPDFRQIASYRSPYLKHCHEISVYERRLYLTSTGYDAIIAFDLDKMEFCWGLHIAKVETEFLGRPFHPGGTQGPPPGNTLHLNNIFCASNGMYISGLRSGGLLNFSGREIRMFVDLPQGTHNARPYKEGVLFNDTESDAVRFVAQDKQRVFNVPRYPDADLTHTEMDDSR